MSAERIRSSHQRRVLDWLLDGGGTVSVIAESLQLRMPHASLALRQLREREEVVRDDHGSIRGAIHRINAVGRRRIAGDAVARVRKFVKKIHPLADAVVLGRDGPNLILGYLKPPRSRLLSLPEQGLSGETEQGYFSTGKKGGRYAIQRDEPIRWYSFPKLETSQAPNEATQGTLGNWSEEMDRIGIVHARLLDATREWSISPGTWYSEPASTPQLPESLTNGAFVIGTATGTDVTVSPQTGIHAHFTLPVNRTLIMNAFRRNAICFEEQRQHTAAGYLPVEALEPWIRSRHPRLSEQKLIAKISELSTALTSESSQAVSRTLHRELLSDFGKVEWTHGSAVSSINLSGVSSNGATALMEWFLNQSTEECIVEWPFEIPNYTLLLERLLTSGRCRLLITSAGEYYPLPSASTVLRSSNELMKASLYLGRGKRIPLTLPQSGERTFHVTHEVVPESADELTASWKDGELDASLFTLREPDVEKRKALWQALSAYPEGDETWANLNESTHPLASWIATPTSNRTSRWIRLRNKLPPGWADLLPIEDCETATLISAMPKASEQWSIAAIEKVRQRFTHNVDSIVRYEHLFQDEEVGQWMATSVLLAASQLPEEFHALIEQACGLWLDAPRQTAKVLQALFPLGDALPSHIEACLSKCKLAAPSHPRNSMLYVWGVLLKRMESNEPLSPEFLRQVMSILPHQWWRPWAGEWLQVQLSSASGRRWLVSVELPWPALLTRPPGERSGMPAWPVPYPNARTNVDELLNILLLEDGIGKPSLLDAYDMLANAERNEPVHYGRIHPLVGWLPRPVEMWPAMEIDVLQQGDREVGALLFARWFAAKLE